MPIQRLWASSSAPTLPRGPAPPGRPVLQGCPSRSPPALTRRARLCTRRILDADRARPSQWGAHAGDAGPRLAGGGAACELLDGLRRLPRALTRTGDSINSAIACPAYATVRRRFRPERIALRPDCESSKAPTHPGLVPMQACRVTPGNSFGSRKALVSTAPARPLVLVQGGRTAQEVWGRDDLVRRDSCKWRAQSSPVGVVGAAKAGQAF